MKNKHTEPEWEIILNLYDELIKLDHDQQHSKLSNLNISKQIIESVRAMLAQNVKKNILDKPIDDFANSLFDNKIDDLQNPEHIIGREFGAWKVIKHLAKGGMGHVYLANRNDGQFEKKVALKIIKSGPFSALTQEKFNTEMRTLAAFEHANISRLIDGGVSNDGISYFVMEYIDGLPITEYANINNLDLKKRITLIIQLCEAVEYAHQNLTIHGDIKPANVLVDEKFQLKLVDFGISQPLLSQQKNLLPRFTPSYSSPEQAKGNTLSTASDVFGICAVLYELCCGFAPRSGSETTSLSEYNKLMDADIVSAGIRLNEAVNKSILKGVNFKNLSSTLNRELGTIIAKGLNVSPKNRYKNSTELANDLKKFISNQAVDTYSMAKSYQLKKSFIRNKLTYAISIFGFIGILTITILALSQAQIAHAEAQKANWSNQFLLGIFEKADPIKNQKNPIVIDDLIQLASINLLEDKENLTPDIKLNALGLLADIQMKLGKVDSVVDINLERLKLHKKMGSDPSVLANIHHETALVYGKLANFNQALSHWNLAKKLVPIDTELTKQSVLYFQSYNYTLIKLDKFKEAKINFQKLESLESKILQLEHPYSILAQIYGSKALMYYFEEDYQSALDAIELSKSYYAKAISEPILYAEIIGIESDIYSNMGEIVKAIKISEESIEIYKDNLGINHPETLSSISNQANNYGRLGEYQKSIEMSLELIDLQLENNYPDSLMVIPYNNIAHNYRKLEDFETALNYFKMAEPIWQTLETKIPSGEMSTLSGTARCYLAIGNYPEADIYFNKALKVVEINYGLDHSIYPRLQLQTIDLYIKQNNQIKINEILPKILNQIIEIYGKESSWYALTLLKSAQYQEYLGHIEKAKELALEAKPILEKTKPANDFIKELNEVLRIINL